MAAAKWTQTDGDNFHHNEEVLSFLGTRLSYNQAVKWGGAGYRTLTF